MEVEDIVAVDVTEFDPAAAEAEEAPRDASTSAEESGQHDLKVQTVRIDVERLDHLMNLIGELVIDRTALQQVGRELTGRYHNDESVEVLGRTSEHIVKVIGDLQEDFMKVRMLPISTVFSSFPGC